MDLIAVKVFALSLLGGVSLLLGFLPLKLGTLVDTSDFEGERNFWKRTVTSVLLCYGGGVLLATSFVHMLPEVISKYRGDLNTKHVQYSNSFVSITSKRVNFKYSGDLNTKHVQYSNSGTKFGIHIV